jgi:hypothetical protein
MSEVNEAASGDVDEIILRSESKRRQTSDAKGQTKCCQQAPRALVSTCRETRQPHLHARLLAQ